MITMANTGRLFLTEKDFVDVVDAEGKALPAVPKHWDETLLAPGAKKSSRRSSSSNSSSSSERKPGEEPKGNASGEEWTAYAREKGATDADLVDEQGEPLSRDALKEKYGSKSS